MKYFKSNKQIQDTSFVLFVSKEEGDVFINYLKSVDGDSPIFKSRLFHSSECPDWWSVNKNEVGGYSFVYGCDIPTEIVKNFFDIMEG